MVTPVSINYSYDDVPTIREFAASNSFIRGIMGPFGCLPGDTEFLTPSGWKRIDAYQDGDQVLQWSPGGTTSFVKPLEYIKKPAEKFIQFETRTLTMRLSEDHRVPHYDWADQFKVLPAAKIANKLSRRKIPVIFEAPARDGLSLSDELIRFAVMMHADGHYPKQGKRALVCVRKERKKERIRTLLTCLGIGWKERTYPKRPTETTFSFEPPYRGKRYEGSWWNATKAQLEVILDEIGHWDGYMDDEGGDLRYFSAFKTDADFIQYAAHACGRVGIMHATESENPKWKPVYAVGIRAHGSHDNCAAIRSETRVTTVRALDGLQFCFTVPNGFFIARCDDRVFVTGNSGKSSGCVIEIIRRALAQNKGPDGIKRSRWLVIRNTFTQLEDSTIRTFLQWFPPQHFGRYYESDHTYHIKALPGVELEILFRALDRPEHVKNLLSLEVTAAWVNEAREVPWSIIDAIQGRVGRYPSKVQGGMNWFGVIMDTNPPDVDSKWYKFFEEANHPPEFAQLFKQPSGLDPKVENLTNLPNPNYYKLLSQGKDPEWVKIYVHGEYGFTADGRPVYTEYKDPIHCKQVQPVKGVTIYRGWDFGLTPACVFSQILPDGRWLIFDELTADSMGIDRFGDELISFTGLNYPDAKFVDIGDPAGEQRAQTDQKTCFQILWSKGIEIEAGEQTLALRLESVKKPLRTLVGGEPQFILHPRCKTLRKGFQGGYQFRRLQTSAERYTAIPDKNMLSHPQDALQYVATRLFGSGLVNRHQELDDFGKSGYGPGDLLDRGRSPITGY